MESLIADFLKSLSKLSKVLFQLARNSSLIGDISEVFSKFTKFLVTIVSGGGDKAIFCISRDHMINELSDSVVEVPSL